MAQTQFRDKVWRRGLRSNFPSLESSDQQSGMREKPTNALTFAHAKPPARSVDLQGGGGRLGFALTGPVWHIVVFDFQSFERLQNQLSIIPNPPPALF